MVAESCYHSTMQNELISEKMPADLQARYDALSLELANGNVAVEAELSALEERLIVQATERRRLEAAERAKAAQAAEHAKQEMLKAEEARQLKVNRLRGDYATALRRVEDAAAAYAAAAGDLASIGEELFNHHAPGVRPFYDVASALQIAVFRDLPDRWARKLNGLVGSPPATVRQGIAVARGLVSNPVSLAPDAKAEEFDDLENHPMNARTSEVVKVSNGS